MANHSLLQGIFPNKGSNPGLLHCRQISYHLSHQLEHKQEIRLMSPVFSSVQFSCSIVSDSLRPHGIATHQASLSITNSRSLLKLMPIESDAIQPSHLLLSPSPPAPIPPSIRVFSNELTLCMRWQKYWSFSFSISPSNEHPTFLHQEGLVGSPCSPRSSQESSPTP